MLELQRKDITSLEVLPSESIRQVMELKEVEGVESVGSLDKEGNFSILESYSQKYTHTVFFKSEDLEKSVCLVHTHNGEYTNPQLSTQDIVTSKKLDIPVLMYHQTFKKWDLYNPLFPHPYPLKIKYNKGLSIRDYVGLQYEILRCDCYSYVREVLRGVYKKEVIDAYKNVDVNNLDFKKIYALFSKPQDYGFKSVQKIEDADVTLLQISQTIPYHVAVIEKANPPINLLHCLSDLKPSIKEPISIYEENIIGIYSV